MGVTAAPAGVWVPTAGRCLAAGSLGGPWRVSVKGGGHRAVSWEGGNLLGPHITWERALGSAREWASAFPGCWPSPWVRLAVLQPRPVSCRTPMKSSGAVKPPVQQIAAASPTCQGLGLVLRTPP